MQQMEIKFYVVMSCFDESHLEMSYWNFMACDELRIRHFNDRINAAS